MILSLLSVRFDKIDGFIRTYDGTRYLVVFGNEKHDSIYNRIRYLISVKSGIAYMNSLNYATIKVDSYDSLPLEKIMTFRNLLILINSVSNKIKITTTIIYFQKKLHMNFLKIKFLYKI